MRTPRAPSPSNANTMHDKRPSHSQRGNNADASSANAKPMRIQHPSNVDLTQQKSPFIWPFAVLHFAGMALVLGHISALEYWLAPAGEKPAARMAPPSFALPRTAVNLRDVSEPCTLMPSVLSAPVHAMTSAAVKNEHPALLVHHSLRSAIPVRSFFRLAKGIYVCSPEMAFVQVAARIPLRELIRLGFELCGSYSLSEHAPGGFFNRKPLMTTRSLRAFIEGAPGMHGSKNAARALRYILPDSASPAETRLAMALSLPCNLGGFGLPQPTMNRRIALSKAERTIAGKSHLRCDLYWEGKGVGVEYDSDLEHTGSERIAADAARRNTLAFASTTLITITRLQYNNPARFAAMAKELAKLLGAQIRPRCRDFPAKQRELRDLLYRQPEWEERRRLNPLR